MVKVAERRHTRFCQYTAVSCQINVHGWFFFSALHPTPCAPCYCEIDLRNNQNVFKCSSKKLTGQISLPKLTEKYVISGTEDTTLTDSFIEKLRVCSTLRAVNFTNNKITKISSNIQQLVLLEEIWMSGNPYDSDCSMTWMIPWLNNFTTAAKINIVRDYKDVKCGTGRFKGIPIHTLTEVALGCYPHKLTSGQIAAFGASAGLMIAILIVVVVVVKKSKEVKFYMFYYLHLNTAPKDDKRENLDKKYDAFFCYR